MSRLLEEETNGVLDTQNLRTKRAHAHIIGDLQRLAEILVRLADVDIAALAIKDGASQLLCDGFWEIVIRFYYDVVVVPWEVDYCEAGDEEDAGRC